MADDKSNLPASARPVTDDKGRTSTLKYSRSHIAQLVAMKRAGKRINLPDGVNMDDYPDPAAKAEGSTGAGESDSLATSQDSAGTAGSEQSDT